MTCRAERASLIYILPRARGRNLELPPLWAKILREVRAFAFGESGALRQFSGYAGKPLGLSQAPAIVRQNLSPQRRRSQGFLPLNARGRIYIRLALGAGWYTVKAHGVSWWA